MDFDKSIDSIYSHPILSSLIKNEATIYGSFLRSILFENTSIDNYVTNKKQIINGYCRTVFRDIIERDLDEYIQKIHKLPSTNETSRCDFVTYTLLYNEIQINIEMSYIKSSISYYLTYYRAELDLTVDIDCIYIDRTGLGSLSINSLYDTAPSPFFKIINNIKNKKFKILSKNNLLLSSRSYNYISDLKKQGWINIENNLENIDIIKDKDITEQTCAICTEPHNVNTVKLKCGHFYHRECLNGYIDNYIKDKDYLTKNLECPYCTQELNILEVL